MFMKIFTMLIISFNNIFTIPQNINNDEMTTQSLIRNKRQSDKIYNFEIRNLKKVQFWISTRKNNLNLYPVKQVVIEKKDNINLNEKLPELKNLNWLIFRFTLEFEDNQNKQDEIRQLITTHGQKIDENNDDTLWIINKKIAIKAQGTSLDTLNHNNKLQIK